MPYGGTSTLDGRTLMDLPDALWWDLCLDVQPGRRMPGPQICAATMAACAPRCCTTTLPPMDLPDASWRDLYQGWRMTPVDLPHALRWDLYRTLSLLFPLPPAEDSIDETATAAHRAFCPNWDTTPPWSGNTSPQVCASLGL